ncbi:hypothetical protein GF312_20775 [Candidatus Poribacteria bacterium]|nr:hypothetical protein [Candidatus Poribacteria bacterium]
MEKIMKIQFSPSVYEHAAFLIERSPWNVSHDLELLWKSHSKAYRMYEHTPIVVGIDIYNIEAEAYGCVVDHPSGNGIPAITRGIISSIEDFKKLRAFDPENDGRIPMIIEAGKKLSGEFPDADIRIPVSGPFSIAVSLRSLSGLLEDVAYRPELVRKFLIQLADNQVNLCKAVMEAGLDVAFFESAAAPPLLSPKQFHDLELPALKNAMEKVSKVVGHPVPCIIGGDTEPILEDILSTGTSYIICPAETNQKTFMEKLKNQNKVKIRINIDPLTVAHGSKSQILKDVDRILKMADGRENILLGTGAVPYETPPENIILIKEYVS